MKFLLKVTRKLCDITSNKVTSFIKSISKVYDPLGYLCLLSVRAKLLFLRTWSEKAADLDTRLTENITHEGIKLKCDFQNKITRYLGDKNHFVFHGFCDASEKAYASAIYAVTENHKDEFITTL
ncbi:unnamed protein product [Parnassius mnemosyne]|uniref:Uncharacterized protein n=1 Tax=Parnassius mnemosyne TaxID=213953 RepID=A0AAV1KJS4_9NEOP